MRILKRISVVLLTASVLPSLTGCALAVGAAIGGTAVYVLKDEGYKVQSPITKKQDAEHQQ